MCCLSLTCIYYLLYIAGLIYSTHMSILPPVYCRTYLQYPHVYIARLYVAGLIYSTHMSILPPLCCRTYLQYPHVYMAPLYVAGLIYSTHMSILPLYASGLIYSTHMSILPPICCTTYLQYPHVYITPYMLQDLSPVLPPPAVGGRQGECVHPHPGILTPTELATFPSKTSSTTMRRCRERSVFINVTITNTCFITFSVPFPQSNRTQ